MYISTLNNKLQDDLSRLEHIDAIKFGKGRGLVYLDMGHMWKSYFRTRMRDFSLILTTDSSERVRAIMQFVEKRIARVIPKNVIDNIHLIVFGKGANGREQCINNPRLSGVGWHIAPWPSEQKLLNIPFPALPVSLPHGVPIACKGTMPRKGGRPFLVISLGLVNPVLAVLDCHPSLSGELLKFPWPCEGRRPWSSNLEAASYVGPRDRARLIIASPRLPSSNTANTDP